MYPTISFYINEDDSLDIYLYNNRLYGELNGETLSDYELINEINSLDECDTVKLIKACGGAKKFKHAYRKLFYENPVKVLDRELRENHSSSLEEYLQLSYRAGLNPLPALRAKGIKVKFSGQNTRPRFTNEDIAVTYDEGFVNIIYNPWDSETETNIVNKGLQFQLDRAADKKRNREYRLKNRIVRKRIVKYTED